MALPPASFAEQLPVAAPFNLEATVRLLQRRPANRIDRWEDDRYRRAFQTGEGLRLLAVRDLGTVDAPDPRLEILGGPVSGETASVLMATARWMLGLDAQPAPTAWLADIDPRLEPVTAALLGFRPPCFPSLFETCARVIPYQQLSLDAGTAIVGRLVERFGDGLAIEDQSWLAFPQPEVIADAPLDALRETGLSRTKATAMQALARQALSGELDAAQFAHLSTPDALAALRALPGIGPWSAGLIMLRGLRRLDVFPPGDVGAARNLAALLGVSDGLTPAEANAYADHFGDRQGYLYFLALGSQLLARGIPLGW
ncbi:MAG: DNA-3-methyladenine glycosylase 2 family protein [Thermomicrobiales bacterium]|nr:DNA-3-methyladenine glycosylase 2 family protein [Thermomicrobiales bacterium]